MKQFTNRKMADLEKRLTYSKKLKETDEEFANFMVKVNEVNQIVNKLASHDAALQKIGDAEAKRYLGEDKTAVVPDLNGEFQCRTGASKTLINKRDNTKKTEQEIFMDEMSRDADRRYKDKQIRREKMETLKKRGNTAFKRGEYEKALSCYSKGIEQIKDSAVMYQNRALVYINLKLYDKAIEDVSWALRLNEDSLKSRLLLAKAHYLQGDLQEFEINIEEALNRNEMHGDFIKEFCEKLQIEE